MGIVKHYKSGLSSPSTHPESQLLNAYQPHHWLLTFWLRVVSIRWWFHGRGKSMGSILPLLSLR